MSWFIDLDDCCGCGACEQSCPTNCIVMSANQEGFFVPKRNIDNCIDCGLCKAVCPVLNKWMPNTKDRECYSCRTIDNGILEKSSSGGVFTHLAGEVIGHGGIVYGATFDDKWDVKISAVEDRASIDFLRGSKYVNASVEHTYQEVLHHIQQGRLVLYSGTPCQIAGLNHFLHGEKNDNLITVDIMCHGVPSPKVWRKYLMEIVKENKIKCVSFRDKEYGWNRYALKIEVEDGIILHEPNTQNTYMRGFIGNLYNRYSCSRCPARGFNSGSDLTIGDYWEIENQDCEFDNKGMSLVVINTTKGTSFFDSVRDKFLLQRIDFQDILKSRYHSTLLVSAPIHPNRQYFFRHLDGVVSVSELIESCLYRKQTNSIIESLRTYYEIIKGKWQNR